MRRPLQVVALLSAGALLTGCGLGSDVRDVVGDAYPQQRSNGDTTVYSSTEPVGATASRIVNAIPPAARTADGGSEYLRYDDDIVIVGPAPNGSTVTVEDIDGRFSRGGFLFLGAPGFRPGSPAGGSMGGGPGDVK
ncbi:MAG: DUF4247 domain-containing protein [Pseudonocardia sp.]|nr:DUF4247 domain-containing protein [Pseudonocardia sp.]